MRAIVKTLLLSVLAASAFSASAMAADILDAPIYETIPEMVPVEIGSGWYLRGDVSYDFKSDLGSSYRTYYEVSPALFDIDGSFLSPATYAYGSEDHDGFEIDAGVDAGVGIGYQFTDYFRGDVTAHYWEHDVSGGDAAAFKCDSDFFPVDTTCRSEDETKMTAWELMANAYVDLGNVIGFTPYVGGGVGAVNVQYDALTKTSFCVVGGTDCGVSATGEHEGYDSWRFAYALMAGASYDLTQSLKLDIGYRYLNVESGDMTGFDSYSAGLGATGVQGFDDGFDRHTIQAGLRYSLF